MTTERTGEVQVNQRPLFEATQRLVVYLYESKPDLPSFRMATFQLDSEKNLPQRDLVVFRYDVEAPIGIVVAPDGSKKMVKLNPESEYYKSVTEKSVEPDEKVMNEVRFAMQQLSNPGKSLSRSGLEEFIFEGADYIPEAINRNTVTNYGTYHEAEVGVVAKGGLIEKVKYTDRDGVTKTATIVYPSETVIFPVHRPECNYAVAIPYMEPKEFESMQQENRLKLEKESAGANSPNRNGTPRLGQKGYVRPRDRKRGKRQ